jgi:hypothetical protein
VAHTALAAVGLKALVETRRVMALVVLFGLYGALAAPSHQLIQAT